MKIKANLYTGVDCTPDHINYIRLYERELTVIDHAGRDLRVRWDLGQGSLRRIGDSPGLDWSSCQQPDHMRRRDYGSRKRRQDDG